MNKPLSNSKSQNNSKSSLHQFLPQCRNDLNFIWIKLPIPIPISIELSKSHSPWYACMPALQFKEPFTCQSKTSKWWHSAWRYKLQLRWLARDKIMIYFAVTNFTSIKICFLNSRLAQNDAMINGRCLMERNWWSEISAKAFFDGTPVGTIGYDDQLWPNTTTIPND